MTKNDRTIDYLRKQIPSFTGPVTTSSEEMARLPVKSEQEHTDALAELNCPHLGPLPSNSSESTSQVCQVYDERPLICRLFGTTPRLACPNGRRPEQMIDPKIEQKIYLFNEETRQVLV